MVKLRIVRINCFKGDQLDWNWDNLELKSIKTFENESDHKWHGSENFN